MDGTFEGTYLGDAAKIGDDAKLECGICWWVYDPATGDDVWQIPAGTPFRSLPDGWRCPVCDAERHQFMVVDPGTVTTEPAAKGESDPDGARVEALVTAYRAADAAMRGLPIHNPALDVAAIGFRRAGPHLVGVVMTPWMMNLTIVPPTDMPIETGRSYTHAFPSGDYDFIGGRLDGFGTVETCSLFSPMDGFEDIEAARLAAEAAIEGLFEAEAPPRAPAPTKPAPSRRGLLFGGAKHANPAGA